MTTVKSLEPNAAIDHLLLRCGNIRPSEKALVLYDATTRDLSRLFSERARAHGLSLEVFEIPVAPIHGTEPPADAAAKMFASDICMGVTLMSLAHTEARRALCGKGGRYLSLPEYSMDLLRDPSIGVDYRDRAPVVRRVADALSKGSRVRVTTSLGTDVVCNIAGREGNYCPGFVEKAGDLGSPPDIEANVSPVETDSHGTIVVDGSIPCLEIGLLKTPVTLEVRGGKIIDFASASKELVATLRGLFERAGDDRAYVLAECGIGLNTAARLTGSMLTDEGAYGNVHFGFGSNATVGGKNKVAFHLDFVCRTASLDIDDVPLIRDGELL
jgi:leucyl aminopeptidase (aminopeptidase T)